MCKPDAGERGAGNPHVPVVSRGQAPEFRTLNDFRGYINGENYFVDGTKIESASGRYTFVWKQSVEKNDRKLDEQRHTSITMIDVVWEDENGEEGDRDREELGGKEGYTSAEVKELAQALKEGLKRLEGAGVKAGKKMKYALKTVEKDDMPRNRK